VWDYEHWKKDPLSQKALARIAELEEHLSQAIRLVNDYGDQLKAWGALMEKQTKSKTT
jgi:hypothetical protein